MRILLNCLALSIVSFSSLSWASSPAEKQVERPKVAVVLAGGGAKGAAHIGVLKALEDMYVPVDIITGTSMGSYFGGLYATGMSADEIASLIDTVEWSSGYRDRVGRSERRARDKEYEDRYQLTTDLGLRWGEIRAPKGVVQGQGMLRILRETSGNLGYIESFDQLAIPYRSVASDIVELEPVIIDKGYLVDAMMASMSVPGALPPYEIDGRLLVDGGVTNNMPVDVARDLGADMVIAVDISTDYSTADDFTSFLSVADQLSNYLVRRSTNEQASMLKEDDVYLRPDVGGMQTTEFDKMPEAFEKGYQATIAMKDKLQKYVLSTADYQTYIDGKQRARKQLRYGDQIQIDNVTINNNTHYSNRLVDNRLNLKAGKTYSTEELEQRVQDLYALDRFELITYQYQNVDGRDELTVDVNEKSWGPNYVNFRFFLEDDFSSDSQYSLGISTNFTDINSHGAELRTNLEMGTDKLVEAQLYSPFFSSQRAFTTLGVTYSNEGRNAPLGGFDDTSLEATQDYLSVTYREWMSEFAIGYQETLWREFKMGLRYTNGDAEVSTLPSCGDVDFTRQGAFVNYRIDSLDDFSLPTRGVYLDLEYLVSRDKASGTAICLGSDSDTVDDNVHEFSAKFIGAHSIKRHTLVANLDLGFMESDNLSLPLDPKELGGFLHLSGIPRNSLIGQNKAFSSLIYRYRWFDNDFGLFTSPFYVGASVEYGGVWSNPDIKMDDLPMYMAGSIFAGVDSPIGPIMLGYGRTENQFDSVYLIIGTRFK